jgi:hypothetical protein
MNYPKWHLPDDRCFDPDPAHRQAALELYESVSNLPIIAPVG